MPTASEYDNSSKEFAQLLRPIEEARTAVAGERSRPGIGGTFASLVDITIEDDFDPADPWNSLPGPRPSEPEPPFPWVEI